MKFTVRNTVRAVLLTPNQEVLLIHSAFPWLRTPVWMLPGGGVETGEDGITAIRREVHEETGMENPTLLGEAWNQDLEVKEKQVLLRQRFFVFEVEKFMPNTTNLTNEETEWLLEYRWWSITDLRNSMPQMEPRSLPTLLDELLSDGVPIVPRVIPPPRKASQGCDM